MSFGFGVGDIMAISELALKVYTAYKDAPDDYRNIADEVKSLHIIIEETAQHFKSTTLSDKKQQGGKEVLEGCQNVLKDLDALIEKYNALASSNTSQVFQRIKLGTEDIVTLRARLTSNTTLLNSFIQRLDITITITIEYIMLISQLSCKLDEIQASSSHKLDEMQAQSQLPEGSNSPDLETSPLPTISTESNQNRLRFPRILPPVDFLVGPLMVGAARTGNIKRLKSTLGYVRDINFMDNTGATALHRAASRGYNDIVQLLLTKGASIEAGNLLNHTPLHRAAFYGHTSTVELLLSKGASIEATNKVNDTPLHLAAKHGNTSIVDLLISKGASIEATNEDNDTPLHFAALYGRTSTVNLLLSKGASIEVTNKDNETPLHLAAWNGHTSTVKLLLSKGASIEATNKDNDTPLHCAAWKGHTSTAELPTTACKTI